MVVALGRGVVEEDEFLDEGVDRLEQQDAHGNGFDEVHGQTGAIGVFGNERLDGEPAVGGLRHHGSKLY